MSDDILSPTSLVENAALLPEEAERLSRILQQAREAGQPIDSLTIQAISDMLQTSQDLRETNASDDLEDFES